MNLTEEEVIALCEIWWVHYSKVFPEEAKKWPSFKEANGDPKWKDQVERAKTEARIGFDAVSEFLNR